MKCSTGKILSVGFLKLFLWEHWHVSLVGSVAQRAGSRGAAVRDHKGQPVASATPQGWCQCGAVHALIRKDPIRVLVGVHPEEHVIREC